MTMPAYRRSIRDIKEALRGLLPFLWVCLKSFVGSDDRIGVVLAAWRYETNRLPPQRPRSA
jgi:hypothetical protein